MVVGSNPTEPVFYYLVRLVRKFLVRARANRLPFSK